MNFSESLGSIFSCPALLDLLITYSGENVVGFVSQHILLGKTTWLVFVRNSCMSDTHESSGVYLTTRWFVEDASPDNLGVVLQQEHGWHSRRDGLEWGLPPPLCIILDLECWGFFPHPWECLLLLFRFFTFYSWNEWCLSESVVGVKGSVGSFWASWMLSGYPHIH